MSGQPIRVTFGVILAVIQARLADLTGLPITNIKLIGRKETGVPKLVGDQDILIRPSRFVVALPEEESAGRISLRLDRTIYVFPRVRMARDEVDRDTQWLTDPANGIFALEESIISILLDWLPADSNGNELCSRGLWLTGGTEAEKELEAPGKPMLWGDSCIAFSALYLPNIDMSDPFGRAPPDTTGFSGILETLTANDGGS